MPLSLPDLHGLRRRLTERMAHPNDLSTPSTTAATPGGSSLNPSLLTPPISREDLDDVPFKAKEDDNTSLSMKKGHRRRLNRACASSDDVKNDSSTGLNGHPVVEQSRSLPNLRSQPTTPHTRSDTSIGDSSARRTRADAKRQDLPRRARRWTMPSKASPTRALTTSPSFVLPPKKPQPGRTPATISLRRATTIHSRRPDVYTSFPEPKFSQQKSGFLFNLWSSQTEPGKPMASSLAPPRRASVAVVDRALQPCAISLAAPVNTEVQVESNVAVPGMKPRRCSTRYVTQNSVYEIVWDENISLTDSSRELSRSASAKGKGSSPTLDPRRHSKAMDKLETQLFKAIKQSRKSSAASINALPDASFQDLIDFKFSRLKNESSLKNLPKSKASARAKAKAKIAAVNPLEKSATSSPEAVSEASTRVDFFPPPRTKPKPASQSSRGTASAPASESPVDDMIQAERRSWEDLVVPDVWIETPKHLPGQTVGAGAHRRRRESNPGRRRSSTVSIAGLPPRTGSLSGLRSRRTSAWIEHGLQDDDNDNERMPLLREVSRGE